jgi:hypothetical protein
VCVEAFDQFFMIAFLWEIAKYQTACKLEIEERLKGHHEKLIERFNAHSKDLLDTFAKALRAARERGEFESSIDEQTISRFLAGLVRAAIFEWKVSGKISDVEQTVRDLLEFIAHGIKSTEPKVPASDNRHSPIMVEHYAIVP